MNMLKVSLEQWRMFRAVVTHGGFNQAAHKIHKSQSSIHRAVQKIETTLGVQLLKIEGRQTKLTAAGKLMLQRANYLLEEAEKVESIAQKLGEGVEGQLKIAVDEIFPQDLLYQSLSATSQNYPMLRIELMETVLTGAKELLTNTHVDIAISPIPLADSISEELCEIEFIAVSHPSHPLHNIDEPLSLLDLKSHRQIVVRDSAIEDSQNAGWLCANQRWTVSHMRTSIDMITNGLGFAWLPKNDITSYLKLGTLKPLRLEQYSRRSSKLYLIYKDLDQLGPAAKSFIHELRYQCLARR